MKQFGTIFDFEIKYYLKNKAFLGTTLFLVVLIAAVMFFPRISESFKKEEADSTEKSIMLVSADSAESAEAVRSVFAEAFTEYEVRASLEDNEKIKEQISSGEAECAFIINSPSSYSYLVENLSMYDTNTAVADEALKTLYRMNAMITGGLSSEEAGSILNTQIEHTTESIGKNQAQNFFYTYIMVFALYMVILMYGQMVTTNVATEKSSRAMELLITSAKPTGMIFGKVIAACLAGLLQLVAVFGSAFIFYNLNKSYWGDNMIINSIFDMPLDLLVYMLLFFVLGFLLYAFMYGAIGSTVSKLEDINTAVMPVTMLFLIAFFVVIFSMTSGQLDNMLLKVCSYIPFTSPMAMFTRIAMSTVPAYEIVISIVILIASVIGIGVLSAKIYRVGVLLYGTRPTLGAILKAIKKA